MKIEDLLKDAFSLPNDYVPSSELLSQLKELFDGKRAYGIFFTARSGSTFLTHELSSTNALGVPHEWFNWTYVKQQVSEQSYGVFEYFKSLLAEKVSSNNVFGFEINWLQFLALDSIFHLDEVISDQIKWFFLRRRNLVAQALSLYIADETKIFHSYQLNEDASKKINSVKYDKSKIEKNINSLCSQENEIVKWCAQREISPICLYYEDVVSKPVEITGLFLNVMGVKSLNLQSQPKQKNQITKMATQINIEYESRFRSEASEFLDLILAKRPPVLVESTTV